MNEVTYPRFRWYAMITVFISVICACMGGIAPAPIVGEISQSLNLDLGTVTAITMLSMTIMVSIGGIVSGIIVDKFGVGKTYITLTAIGAVVSFLLLAVGHSVIGLVVIRGIQGFCAGALMASYARIASEWFPPKQRGLSVGIMSSSVMVGFTFGLIVSPALSAKFGWLAALTILGGLYLVATILFIIYSFGPKSPGCVREEGMREEDAHDFSRVLKLPVFYIGILSIFAMAWASQGFQDLTPGHIAVPPPTGLGLGSQVSGTTMAIYTVAGFIGTILSGIAIEKVFHRNFKVALPICYFLAAVFCVATVVPFIVSSYAGLVICLILAGVFINAVGPLNFTFISIAYPERITGRVGGLTSGIGFFGGTVGVAVGSAALHATGMYIVSAIVVGAVLIFGALISMGMKKPKIFDKVSDSAEKSA